MKILVDARSLGRRPSGIGMYLYSFIKQLNTYEDVEIGLVTDVSESAEMLELADAGAEIYAYGKVIDKSIGLFSYYRFVQKTINKVQPDIFWEGNNLVPVKMKNPYGKFVTTIYDMFPLYMKDCYGKIYPYYFRYGVAKTLKQVDAAIYISEETKKETEYYFPVAKTVKSFLSYIIIESEQKAEIKDENYLLYIGNLEKRKGTDILFKAFEKYKAKGGRNKLLFAGKFRENDIEQLYEQVREKTTDIIYQGYVDDLEKNQLLAECSAFIFPTRAEGFGIPVVEALEYNKMVLASDLSIFREIVGESVQYVSCDEYNASDVWAEKMLELDNQSYEVDYINPYTAGRLGEKLYNYFKGMI